MSTRSGRAGLAAVLAVAGLLLFQPGKVQAHPQFAGKWMALTPPGGFMLYEFGVGDYIGNGIWRGPFSFVVSGLFVEQGEYELRMFNGTQGTISLRSHKTMAASSVGNVDLAARAMDFMGVNYRH
jgi:hypothetical protein